MATKTQAIYIPAAFQVELREETVADPGPEEIQVRTLANGICMFEVSIYNGTEPRFLGNKGGHEGVGVVTKVGKDVKGYKEGDYVACSNWSTVLNQPANVARLTRAPKDPTTFLIEPACCVVTAVRSYDITPGDRVLVLGAGYMGLLNVQALAHCPLAELVVSDIKDSNLALAKQYGATETINNGSEEGKARLEELMETPFDLVVECAGVVSTLEMAGFLTRSGGRLGIFSWHHQPRTVDFGLWHMKGLKVLNAAPNIGRDHKVDAMQRAVWLLERGVFDMTCLVTHRHRFDDVANAMEIAATRPESYIKGVLDFQTGGI